MMQDTISGLIEQMNQNLSEVDRKFHNLEHDEPPLQSSSQQTLDHSRYKMKP